ncbi:MAG TPA: (Fe-S)-binding protein [Lysobacter sp.]
MPPAPRSPLPGPPDPLVALADRCVQCGLCLPACPTYATARIEAESPRGRIALARAWALDVVEPSAVGDAHLDHCLGCRSCEAVCPAGVEYGALLVQARDRQRRRHPAGLRRRAIEALAARPRLFAALIHIYDSLRPVLPRGWRRLPPVPRRRGAAGAGIGNGSGGITVFAGCVAGPYEAGLRDALARCCAALGIGLTSPAGQTCCGSLHAHGGNGDAARRLAASNRAAFSGADAVLTLASGCHEAVAGALSGTAPTLDALEFLAREQARRPQALRWRRHEERVALHLPCTQRNVVRSVPALRSLLASVPGLEVIELDAGHGCCGASGLQALEDPARAGTYRAPLLRQLAECGATRLLSANIGCRLHLATGTSVPVQHPLEFLAELLEPPRDDVATTPGRTLPP